MQDILDDFIAFLLSERGFARNTAIAYDKDILRFGEFAVARSPSAAWDNVTTADATAWLASLSASGAANPATLARKRSALRTFAKHLTASGVRRDDFTVLLEGPRPHRPLPDTLTEHEMEKLVEAPPMGDPYGLRDRAMLEMMYGSGLRVSELCGLTLQSVDIEAGFLRVLGKGNKERIVPVGGKALLALRNYLAAGRPHFVSSKTGAPLFLSDWGNAISRKTFWVHLQKHARRAGITRRVNPHLLRHSFATHLLAHGAGLRDIQEMLGHADISTTEIYTAVEKRRLVEAHALHHPRSKMKPGEKRPPAAPPVNPPAAPRT
jgi:integrase/recombinase XerD